MSSDNHKAIVAKIYTRKHPNADKLLIGSCLGYQLICGLDTKDGDLGLLFPEGLQLSNEYVIANDLIRRTDENGNAVGGMFDQNRRVRVQKFRGEKSEAYWAPLSSLHSFGGTDCLSEGDLLESFYDTPLCNKYITRATSQSQNSNKKVRRGELFCLPKHIDTAQFKRAGEQIPVGATIYITLKIHGTSGRLVRTKVDRELSWFERVKLKLGFRVNTLIEDYVTGTRNVIVSDDKVGFYSNDMRNNASSLFYGKLPLNLAVFFEIVGWEHKDVPIMPTVSTKVLKDKEFTKKYGETITYKYGCPNGQLDVYVYRMLLTTEDGHHVELPWSYVKEYCNRYGVKHVMDLCEPFVYDGNLEALTEKLSQFIEGEDPIDASHIREGIVIRYEKGLDVNWMKWKSFDFLRLEHASKDNDIIDLEEIS